MQENHSGDAAGLDERARLEAPAATPFQTYEIYTDGSAQVGVVAPGAKAEGPCGWAFVIVRSDGETRERFGEIPHGTNNRAEMTAVIEALGFLPADRSGVVRSDSQLVVNGMNVYRPAWEARSFAKVANVDLWRQLYALADTHPGIRFEWVKGHSTNKHNNRADRLAEKAARAMKEKLALAA
jgi:ribonuclease HI